MLGWMISRVTGKSVTDLASEQTLRRMGAEQDAYQTVWEIQRGVARSMLNGGTVVDKISAGGDPSSSWVSGRQLYQPVLTTGPLPRVHMAPHPTVLVLSSLAMIPPLYQPNVADHLMSLADEVG